MYRRMSGSRWPPPCRATTAVTALLSLNRCPATRLERSRQADLLVARIPSTGWVPRPSSKSAAHGQRPRRSAHTNCKAVTLSPKMAIAQYKCASGCVTWTVSTRGPAGRVVCIPGVSKSPTRALRAAMFNNRCPRRGERPVTTSSGSRAGLDQPCRQMAVARTPRAVPPSHA